MALAASERQSKILDKFVSMCVHSCHRNELYEHRTNERANERTKLRDDNDNDSSSSSSSNSDDNINVACSVYTYMKTSISIKTVKNPKRLNQWVPERQYVCVCVCI